MGKTSSAVKNRYNAKAYDQLPIRVPKGRKQTLEAFAREHGESVNGLVNRLVRAEMGLSEDEWKVSPTEEASE
ncbi:MAG: antitoxin [Clostridia bacterium]|nr:antitoxin [Clostridia bacterium]